MIKTFLLEPSGGQRRWLRRYVHASGHGWTCAEGWHEAMTLLGDFPEEQHSRVDHDEAEYPHEDSRWPRQCEKCAYQFAAEDTWQVFTSALFKRSDNGDLTTLREAPPGAMWYATWLEDLRSDGWWKGSEGRVIVCKTPGGDWMIDSRASNCTMPEDNTHRCWIRHGIPPELTVDKNGNTCAAGAGSILCGSYHGFLQNGYLT